MSHGWGCLRQVIDYPFLLPSQVFGASVRSIVGVITTVAKQRISVWGELGCIHRVYMAAMDDTRVER